MQSPREIGEREVQIARVLRPLGRGPMRREQAERASQVKSSFLGLVSHEMRTPLSTIQMNLQLLQRDRSVELPPVLRSRLDRLANAARQLGTLVEGLLDHARIESGRLQTAAEPLDLRQLAAESVEEFQLRLPADGSVSLRLQADAPVTIHSDPRLLKVVLDNLLANALKFTREGTVTVHAAAAPEGGSTLAVQDTGMGIAPEDLDRVFLPFEQLEPLQRKSVPGVGLGLTLARQIVAALGGELRVDSRPGQGTVFTVRLPAPHAGTDPARAAA